MSRRLKKIIKKIKRFFRRLDRNLEKAMRKMIPEDFWTQPCRIHYWQITNFKNCPKCGWSGKYSLSKTNETKKTNNKNQNSSKNIR